MIGVMDRIRTTHLILCCGARRPVSTGPQRSPVPSLPIRALALCWGWRGHPQALCHRTEMPEPKGPDILNDILGFVEQIAHPSMSSWAVNMPKVRSCIIIIIVLCCSDPCIDMKKRSLAELSTRPPTWCAVGVPTALTRPRRGSPGAGPDPGHPHQETGPGPGACGA